MDPANTKPTPNLQSKPNEGFQSHRELLMAAGRGDVEQIKCLLEKEEDAAAAHVHEIILQVENVVNTPASKAIPLSEAVTSKGDSVLHVVASSGDADEFLESAKVIVGKANHLLVASNKEGDTPLHCATRLGSATMVSHLLGLAKAGDGAGDERVKKILRMQNVKGETVLHEAIRLEDKCMVGELLSADAQLARVPPTDGVSPLYLALSLGHRDIARQLLEKDKELSFSGPDGQNAFHAAVFWEHGEEVTKMLLERNKDLLKQADRSTGRTPLHMAALFGEASVTRLLLSADTSPAYLPDSSGSFPIHLAASNSQPDSVLALLQESGPYCAQLRDGQGRTFLHVAAVQKLSDRVVRRACKWPSEKFASSVMNMQDDDGNTALHLAVQVEDVRAVHALVSIPGVKLNLTNKKGETPRELAFIRNKQQGTNSRDSNPESRIYCLLHDAADLTASPRENILPREIDAGEDRSQTIISRTQIVGLGSVLVTTVTFAAAFAVPGGYRADGTPMLAGQYAFDAFVVANTLAFIYSGLSIIYLMFAGLGDELGIFGLGRRLFSFLHSVNLLACSARCLGSAFAFGVYAVLAPVERTKALSLWTMTWMFLVLGTMEANLCLRMLRMVYSDKVVLVKRFGSRAWWKLARPVVVILISDLFPYFAIAIMPLK